MRKIITKKPWMLLMLASSLLGCKEEEAHDAEYYYQNFDKCREQVEKCRNNPKLADTLNCKNAMAGYHKRLMKGDGTFKMPTIK